MLHSTSDRAIALRKPRIAPSRTRAWTARSAAWATQELLDERDELGPQRRARRRSRGQRQRHGALAAASSSRTANCRTATAAVFSEAAHEQMWTPVVLAADRSAARRRSSRPSRSFSTYALGWDVQDYRGAKIVWHGGAVFGFLTAVVLLPEKNVGFAIEINSEDGAIVRWPDERVARSLSRRCLTRSGRQNSSPARRRERSGRARRQCRPEPRSRPKSAHRSRSRVMPGPIADPWYGNVEITAAGGQADDRFQVDAANERTARALAIRHLHHALHRQNDRAGLRHFRARCRWQNRSHHDEAGVAAGRFQLRLPGPATSIRSKTKNEKTPEPNDHPHGRFLAASVRGKLR